MYRRTRYITMQHVATRGVNKAPNLPSRSTLHADIQAIQLSNINFVPIALSFFGKKTLYECSAARLHTHSTPSYVGNRRKHFGCTHAHIGTAVQRGFASRPAVRHRPSPPFAVYLFTKSTAHATGGTPIHATAAYDAAQPCVLEKSDEFSTMRLRKGR